MHHLTEKRHAKLFVFTGAKHKGMPRVVDQHGRHAKWFLAARLPFEEQQHQVLFQALKRQVLLTCAQFRMLFVKYLPYYQRKLICVQRAPDVRRQSLNLSGSSTCAVRTNREEAEKEDGRNKDVKPVHAGTTDMLFGPINIP